MGKQKRRVPGSRLEAVGRLEGADHEKVQKVRKETDCPGLACAVVMLFALTISASAASSHTHSYTQQVGSPQTSHPHKTTWKCECGATSTTYPLASTCSSCTSGAKTKINTAKKTFVFVYIDGDNGIGVPVSATADCYVEYSNYCSFPFSMTYNYPAFASFSSIVKSYATISSIYPSLTCVSRTAVKYYSSSGTLLSTQSMKLNYDNNAIPYNTATVYTLTSKPSYTTSGATFAMPTSGKSYILDVTTYLS